MSGNASCEELWDYVDGEGEAESFRDHLASCSTCRRDLDEWQEIAEALRGSETREPPPGIRSALLVEFRRLHRTSAGDPAGATRGWPRVPAWALAAVLVITAGVAFLIGSWSEQEASRMEIPGSIPSTGSRPGTTQAEYEVRLEDGSIRTVTRTFVVED